MIYLIGLIVLAAVPVVLLAVLSLTSRRPDTLGVTAGRLAPCPSSPNCVSSRAEDEAHGIEPLSFPPGPADQAMARLQAALALVPRVRIVTIEGDYLHAEATSAFFRFVDDLEFLLDREAGVIHVRSASRAGHSDLGVNRRRMEQIRQALIR